MELIFEWGRGRPRLHHCLMDPATKLLQPRVRRTRQGVRDRVKITISKTILDYVIERNEGVITSDARMDDRWNPTGSIFADGHTRGDLRAHAGAVTTWWAQIYIDTSTSPATITSKKAEVAKIQPKII